MLPKVSQWQQLGQHQEGVPALQKHGFTSLPKTPGHACPRNLCKGSEQAPLHRDECEVPVAGKRMQEKVVVCRMW